MTLRDILRKKGDMDRRHRPVSSPVEKPVEEKSTPEFKFVRSTTNEQEDIHPPDHPAEELRSISWSNLHTQPGSPGSPKDKQRKRRSIFRSPSSKSAKSHASSDSDSSLKSHRSLSKRLSSLHLRSPPPTSLPGALLASPPALPAPATPSSPLPAAPLVVKAWSSHSLALLAHLSTLVPPPPPTPRSTGDDDAALQRAIALHESGALVESHALLASLPQPMARLLLALSLRHGWGCSPSPITSFSLLCSAARSAPERPLALYELGQSLRHGWGVASDAVAARACFAAAANLGDVDAAGEVAGMMLSGEGGGKDRVGASGYLRRAQGMGRSATAEGWCWKEKYDP